MPQRPSSHIISDQALNRVMHVCNQCGWACEVVQKDYGEDLLVQTELDGNVDECRLWIQVKGTKNLSRYKTKKHGISMKIAMDRALRWIRSADLVVVVLWDVTKNRGLWTLPRFTLDEVQWRVLQQQESRLFFRNNAVFNKNQGVRIGWIARVYHYTRLLSDDIGMAFSHARLPYEQGKNPNRSSKIPLIGYDFLCLLGILSHGTDSIDKSFLNGFKNARSHFAKELSSYDKVKISRMAIGLALLGTIDKKSRGLGLPPILSETCTSVLFEYMTELKYIPI